MAVFVIKENLFNPCSGHKMQSIYEIHCIFVPCTHYNHNQIIMTNLKQLSVTIQLHHFPITSCPTSTSKANCVMCIQMINGYGRWQNNSCHA